MKATKAKKPTQLESTKRELALAKAELKQSRKEASALKETVDLASAILFYILQFHNDGVFQDAYKTVFHKELHKAFDLRPKEGFHFELDRDTLKQCYVVAVGHQALVKELPQPEMSPIIIK